MNRLTLAVLVAAVLTLALPCALAQDQIDLGGSSLGSLVFTGSGTTNGGSDFTLSETIANAPASGQGVFGTSPPCPAADTNCSGFYTLAQNGSITGTFTGSNTWSISQANGIGFDFSSGKNGSGTLFLAGNLHLVSLAQVGKNGIFNDQLVANLTGLTGTLASLFSAAGAIVNITIDFSTGQNLATLGSSSTFKDNISSGEITPTPEPGTMVLFGTGLAMFGGLLRKRFHARLIEKEKE